MAGMKILVCANNGERDSFFSLPAWKALHELSAEVVVCDSAGMNSETLAEVLVRHHPDVLVSAWSTPRLSEAAMDSILVHLRLMTHLGGSLKSVLPRGYLEKGLLATNWGDAISRTVAECALMLVLCCLRRTAQWQIEMHVEHKYRNREWRTLSLFERRVGFFGFGRVAQALAVLLKPFDVQLSAYDPPVPASLYERHQAGRCKSLKELFERNQVVVNVAPSIPEYHKIVTEEMLRSMPEDAVFVNIGRGVTVDEAALIRVAQEGRVQLGLDVYEVEPLPAESPLRGLKNVCLLPHIGGPTMDRRQDAGKRAVALIEKWSREGFLNEAVTVDEYDRAT